MKGLFKKALDVIKNDNRQLGVSDMKFDSDSGISVEDQEEIIKDINKIMTKSKIQVTPALFSIKAKKRGFFFPFLINLLAILLLAGGIICFYLIFRMEESQIVSKSGAAYTASKEIIEQIKKEKEEEINRKNKEISRIQSDLELVNSDLEKLKLGMDEEIDKRKMELEQRYAEELEVERKRLQEAGITDINLLNEQIEALKSQQDVELQTELDKIKKEEEEKIAKREEELQSLKGEYSQQLTQAQEELKATEQKYASQIESLEEEKTKAEETIRSLTEEKEKINLINEQIVGYYNTVKADINRDDYNAALTDLAQLKAYLDDPNIMGIPEIRKKRDVEIFIIDSLNSLIKDEMKKGERDTDSLINQANIVTDIRELVLAADQAYQAGNKTKAEENYIKALEKIPEIKKSHDYFLAQIDEIENYRQGQVAAFLNAANTQFNAGNYQAVLENYTKALEYLPKDQNVSLMMSRMKTASYELEKSRLQTINSEKAQLELTNGNNFLNSGEYDQAISAYLYLVSNYPNSTQVPEALRSINTAIKNKDQDFQNTINQIKSQETAISNQIEGYKSEIESLKQKIAEKDQYIASLEGAATTTTTTITSTESGQESSSIEEGSSLVADDELNAYKQKAELYDNLQQEYYSYSNYEDKIEKLGSESALIEGKSYLDVFLSSDSVESTFPGFLLRIKKYDQAFEKVGRESSIQDMIDIIEDLAQYSEKTDKISYLNKELANVDQDDYIAVLLKSLLDLISNQ